MHKLFTSLTRRSTTALVGIGAHSEPVWVGGHSGRQLSGLSAAERELFWALERAGRLASHESSFATDDSKPRVLYRLDVEHSDDFVAVMEAALTIVAASEAVRWYGEARIASLDNRPPEMLIANGQTGLVIEYLYHVEQGGYA